jgi:hypothetical protein
MEGGIGIAELLYQTNLLLLVGGGPTPKFPSHKAILWDDYQRQIVGEIILKFPIKRVKVRKEKYLKQYFGIFCDNIQKDCYSD